MQESAVSPGTHLHMMGNDSLLARCTTSFLCSHSVPDIAFAPIRQWVQGLSPQHDCVMVGCLAGMERFVLRLLVANRIPVIMILAEALPQNIQDVSMMVPDITLSEAMGAGRLLVLSVNSDAEQVCANADNARQRNLWMMDFAKQVVVGYVCRQGRLFQQLQGRSNIKVLCPPID